MSTVAVQSDERALYDALRRGDEAAFKELVGRYHSSLLRLAMVYVKNRAVAEEVVQETWLGVIQGLDRFESRSLLKTWIFRILTNKAKTRAYREARSVPFSSFEPDGGDDGEASVEPGRFLDASHPTWPGHWASPPQSWNEVPDSRLVSKETRRVIETAIRALPPAQSQVIALRDVEGWSAEEVCALLDISEANQRVLLHRARSKVRAALERYFDT
jgi:RNA polymerase sigma-70 factor (ECF subfamily)